MQRIMRLFDNNRVLKLLTNRELFIKIYILSCLLWFFPALGLFIDPICKICFIWGILLIGYDILGKRFVLQAAYWYWFNAMLVSYCVTILVNVQTNFYMGIKHLFYSAIALMIIFTQNGYVKNHDEKKLIKWVNSSIIIITFLASTISLIMYCLHLSIRFEQNGVIFRQGFIENRLFGVYGSPNIGALFSVICIALICINAYIERGSLLKWRKFYILNGIIQLLYFSLTLSNGGFLTAVVFTTLLICVFVFMELRKNKGIVKSILFSILLATVAAICLNYTMLGIRKVMSLVPSTFEYVKNSIFEENEGDEQIKIVFDRIESGDDVSNGRTTIWSASLKIWIQSPLFGIADARVDEDNPESFAYSLDELNDAEMERMTAVEGNLHNSYIQILTNSGIAGFICFLVFIILVIKKYIKYLFVEDTKSGFYKIIGMLFCMLGAIGANGMVENHLLFNRQDPRGMIFWFYLGCGLILIKNAVSESRFKDYACRKEKNKFLFACDTPLQLFNSINFVENNQMGSAGKSDLIIIHQFSNSYTIADKIKGKGIFSHVYDAIPIKEKRGIKSKFNTLFRVLYPKKAVHESLGTQAKKMSYCHRNYFLSFQTPTTIGFQLANPYADIYLMEDGLGTYVGNIEQDFTSPLYKLINNYFLERRMSLNPLAVYMNNPQLCHSSISAEFSKLHNLKENPECLRVLMDIFDYSPDKRSSVSKFIYMTQPLEEMSGYIPGEEAGVLQTLREVLNINDVEVRIHPRQKNYSADGLKIGENSQMWELECIYKISDSKVLISAYSTTLFMPKILNDAEPVLIFIYKFLFSGVSDKDWREKEKFIKDFAAEYTDPSKIFIPETLDEFRQILENLKQGSQ